MLTLSFIALPCIMARKNKWMWSMIDSSSDKVENSEISADTICDGAEIQPLNEVAQVDRMSTDRILQNPAWAAIYRRGWEARSVDLQRSQELAQQLEQSAASNLCEAANNSDLAIGRQPSVITSAVKQTLTDTQRARSQKYFQMLKDQKKAKLLLVNKQQCELTKQLGLILDPDASVLVNRSCESLACTDSLDSKSTIQKIDTGEVVDLEPKPKTPYFDWSEEVEKYLLEHATQPS